MEREPHMPESPEAQPQTPEPASREKRVFTAEEQSQVDDLFDMLCASDVKSGAQRTDADRRARAEFLTRAYGIDFERRHTERVAAREERKVERKGILGDLERVMRNKYAKYAVAGYLGLSGVAQYGFNRWRESDEGRERAGAAAVEASKAVEVDLEKFDERATPERMRAMLNTMPKSWLGADVASIRYEDRDGDVVANVTPEARAIAVASQTGGATAKTNIVIYRNMKSVARATTFGDVMPHELAHANDWDSDASMPDARRKELHDAVLARIDAPDRLKSAYVESIANDKKEQRAQEYWAELSAAYLGAAHPEKDLSPADLALIDGEIRRTDPDFDQHAAHAARMKLLADMRWADAKDSLEQHCADTGVDANLAQEAVDWVTSHVAQERVVREERQFSARGEIVSLVTDWAVDSAQREYVAALALVFATKERMTGVLATTDDLTVTNDVVRALAADIALLQDAREELSEDAAADVEAFTLDFNEQYERTGVVLGDPSGTVVLEFAEATTYAQPEARTDGGDPEWIVRSFGWVPPEELAYVTE